MVLRRGLFFSLLVFVGKSLAIFSGSCTAMRRWRGNSGIAESQSRKGSPSTGCVWFLFGKDFEMAE